MGLLSLLAGAWAPRHFFVYTIKPAAAIDQLRFAVAG